jgi:glucose-1-phosphate cytidylyltransferase
MKKSRNFCRTVILCGGKGTRLGKLGKKIPKALVELDGKSILYHKMIHSIEQGFDDFIVAIGYKGNMIVEACEEMELECNIEYSDSGKDAGMLRRIWETQDMFEKRVIVTYGDSLADLDLGRLMDFHLEKGSLVSLVVAPIQSPFGLVTCDSNSRVLTLEEKPILHYYIGTFIMEKKALEFIPEEINKWEDGRGLIAFFKILGSMDELYTYIYEGPDITFNTVEEVSAARDGFLKFYTHFGKR